MVPVSIGRVRRQTAWADPVEATREMTKSPFWWPFGRVLFSIMNMLRERIGIPIDPSWPNGIGSWGDIYDEEREIWYDDEEP
jgi:hypothetical protein